MVSRGCMLKSALVAAVLMAAIHSGSAVEKLASCCTTVNRQKIKDPITDYMVQPASGSCVPAVIFQTDKGLFCSHISAPWVRHKIMELRKAKAQASLSRPVPSSTSSLLSIITSTASLPSPSTPSSSSSSFPSSSSKPTSSPSPSPSSTSSFSVPPSHLPFQTEMV